jgi:hypothetical protein
VSCHLHVIFPPYSFIFNEVMIFLSDWINWSPSASLGKLMVILFFYRLSHIALQRKILGYSLH